MRISITDLGEGLKSIEIETATPTPNEADYASQILESVVGSPVLGMTAEEERRFLLPQNGEDAAEIRQKMSEEDENPFSGMQLPRSVQDFLDRLGSSDHIHKTVEDLKDLKRKLSAGISAQEAVVSGNIVVQEAVEAWARAVVDVMASFEGADRDDVCRALVEEMDRQGAHPDADMKLHGGPWAGSIVVPSTDLNFSVAPGASTSPGSAGTVLQHVSAPRNDAAEEDGYDGPIPVWEEMPVSQEEISQHKADVERARADIDAVAAQDVIARHEDEYRKARES